jgi:large repetitive protein
LLRNLDDEDLQEGLTQKAASLETFPLGDGSLDTPPLPDGECWSQLSTGCNYPLLPSTSDATSQDAYLAHVAEGIDDVARNEFSCLSGGKGQHNVIQSQSTLVHAIPLRPSNYVYMAEHGTALSWSPRSNIALYGNTATVTAAARVGVHIALGTDWMITGSMNLLRELRCADEFNRKYLDSFFTDEDLWRMVTSSAAEVTATDEVIGSLSFGKIADIAVFNGAANPNYRAVIAADPQDVMLVMRGGTVLYGDEAVISSIPGSGSCDTLNVCGATKKLCLSELGTSYAALRKAARRWPLQREPYPAYFCGTPRNEPPCTPSRDTYTGISIPSDGDGDGVATVIDNCPAVFNPIRPVDGVRQADEDLDGVGDACDTVPQTAPLILLFFPLFWVTRQKH